MSKAQSPDLPCQQAIDEIQSAIASNSPSTIIVFRRFGLFQKVLDLGADPNGSCWSYNFSMAGLFGMGNYQPQVPEVAPLYYVVKQAISFEEHDAKREESLQKMQLLLKAGADVEKKYNGKSATDLVEEHRHVDEKLAERILAFFEMYHAVGMKARRLGFQKNDRATMTEELRSGDYQNCEEAAQPVARSIDDAFKAVEADLERQKAQRDFERGDQRDQKARSQKEKFDQLSNVMDKLRSVIQISVGQIEAMDEVSASSWIQQSSPFVSSTTSFLQMDGSSMNRGDSAASQASSEGVPEVGPRSISLPNVVTAKRVARKLRTTRAAEHLDAAHDDFRREREVSVVISKECAAFLHEEISRSLAGSAPKIKFPTRKNAELDAFNLRGEHTLVSVAGVNFEHGFDEGADARAAALGALQNLAQGDGNTFELIFKKPENAWQDAVEECLHQFTKNFTAKLQALWICFDKWDSAGEQISQLVEDLAKSSDGGIPFEDVDILRKKASDIDSDGQQGFYNVMPKSRAKHFRPVSDAIEMVFQRPGVCAG